MYEDVGSREWKYNESNFWRYQKKNTDFVMEDFYLKSGTQGGHYVPVYTTHSKESAAYWGTADKVLKGKNSGYQLRQKVLGFLSQNPNVLWTLPPVLKANDSKKRKKAPAKRDSDSDLASDDSH